MAASAPLQVLTNLDDPDAHLDKRAKLADDDSENEDSEKCEVRTRPGARAPGKKKAPATARRAVL